MKKSKLAVLSFMLILGLLPGCGPEEVVKEEATVTATAVAEAEPTATVAEAEPTATAEETVAVTQLAVSTPETNVVARVNGQPILLEEYQKEVAQAEAVFLEQGLDPESEEGRETLAGVRRQILEQMIDQVLIEQAAAKEGITISEGELEAEIQKTIQEGGGQEKFNQWLEDTGQTYDDFRRGIRSSMLTSVLIDRIVGSLPTTMEQVHARHILLLSEEEAQQVLAKLKAGEDFAALAQQYSQDMGSKDNGGDIGFFPQGIMLPEFEEAAFSLPPGEVSSVVRSQFGFHIIQVLEKDPARELSPEMLQSLRQQTFMKWLEEQRAKATVERFLESE